MPASPPASPGRRGATFYDPRRSARAPVSSRAMTSLLLAVLVAQAPDAPTGPRPLKWEQAVDVPATFLMAGFWLVTETALKDTLAPSSCHWCATDAIDLGVRRAFVGDGRGSHAAVDAASNVAVALAPVVMGGLDALLVADAGGTWRDWSTDFLLMSEATAAAMALDQVVKFSVGRERPS